MREHWYGRDNIRNFVYINCCDNPFYDPQICFFELDLSGKKQRIFYVMTLIIGLIVMFVSDGSYATLAIQLMVGINIFLARKNTDS